METLKLVAVVTKTECYIADERSVLQGRSYSNLSAFFFDGVQPMRTWLMEWYVIQALPEKVECKVGQPAINHRYELIDPTLESDRFPLVMTREEACDYDENDGWMWKDETAHMMSLYRSVCDYQPDIMEEVEFEMVGTIEIDKIPKYNSFEYPVISSFHDPETKISDKKVTHQLIDRIVFPQLLHHTRPCQFTSQQVYKIVRAHIRANINPEWAEITSDYEFCFTVKKKIRLVEPEPYTIDVNAFYKRRKPKYETRYRRDRGIVIFEMTYSPYNYKGYTPIKGMVADNMDALVEKMDKYLEEIMAKINEPLIDCPQCKGMGILLKEEKDAHQNKEKT